MTVDRREIEKEICILNHPVELIKKEIILPIDTYFKNIYIPLVNPIESFQIKQIILPGMNLPAKIAFLDDMKTIKVDPYSLFQFSELKEYSLIISIRCQDPIEYKIIIKNPQS